MNDLSKYLKHRPKMDTGDLLLFRGRGVVSWLIRRFTGGDVTHAAIVLRSREFLEERVIQIGAVGQGFIPTILSDYLAHYHGNAYWLPLKTEYHPLRREMGREALKKSGVKYDHRNLIRQALSRVSLDASQLFCSEAYQWIGYAAGLPKLPHYESIALYPSELEKLGWTGERHAVL